MAACLVCSSSEIVPFIDLGTVPIFCNVQWSTREQALQAGKAPLSLSACGRCGHIFNEAHDETVLAYSPGYDNTQHYSSTFQVYAEQLVSRLIHDYDIRDKTVVDIGCGRGDLLQLIAARGQNRGFGFDPSFAGAPADALQNVTITREYFGRAQALEIKPSLVCCRHVLEHIPQPQTFLAMLHDALSAAGSPILYLEVPNGEHLLKTLGLWDYIYEHVSYFSSTSLRTSLEHAGFEVLQLREDFGGQFLCVEARPIKAPTQTQESLVASHSASAIQVFSAEMQRKLTWWREWSRRIGERKQQSSAVWGAGSKGVMFLNLLELSSPGPLDYVIDQNPGKSGRFVAGTGQVVVLPTVEHVRGFSEIVLMNSIYAKEVASRLAELGSPATIITADGLIPAATSGRAAGIN